MDAETTPNPDDNNPLHNPPFVYRRGHLYPSESDWQFDENNQPIRSGVPESLGGDIPDREAPVT